MLTVEFFPMIEWMALVIRAKDVNWKFMTIVWGAGGILVPHTHGYSELLINCKKNIFLTSLGSAQFWMPHKKTGKFDYSAIPIDLTEWFACSPKVP